MPDIFAVVFGNMADLHQTGTDDLLLWDLFREGDEPAFAELSRRHYRKLVHYGRKFCPDQALIEDTIQEVLIYLWVHRERLGSPSSVRHYLLKSFRHELLRALHRQNPTVEWTEQWDHLHAEGSREDLLILSEEESEAMSRLSALLGQLPARQREILYLRYYQDLGPEEIAQLLDMKPQSVSNSLYRSLSTLRENWPAAFSVLLNLLFQ